MKNISQLALDKIKKKNIRPCSKWMFVLKNYSWWVAGILSVLIGGLGSSVVFYMLINNDWDIYKRISTNLIAFVFVTMPYFWLVFLIIFIVFADFYLKHTKNGYRFSLFKLASLSVFVSLVLGTVFYNFGLGEYIEAEFSKMVPGYDNLIHDKNKMWQQPEKGLLAGTIISIENNESFMLRDLNKKNWRIKGENLFIRRMTDFSIGVQIKLIGEMKNNELFIAKEVRPWIGRGRNRQ